MPQYDRELGMLDWEVYETRRLVLHLLDPELSKMLQKYDFTSIHDWREFVEAKTVDSAKPFEGTERAMCPLCKDGPRIDPGQGFLVPGGLIRHLRGTHRFPRCQVMTVAEELAKGEILKTPRGRAVLT